MLCFWNGFPSFLPPDDDDEEEEEEEQEEEDDDVTSVLYPVVILTVYSDNGSK